MSINNQIIKKEGLSGIDSEVIDSLLSRSPNNPPELEDIWWLMDNIWNEIGCDNRSPDWDKISEFYKHPVWILNGLFIEQHELSMQHRHAISDWIVRKDIKQVLDYGGGFGTLARLICDKAKDISVDIYEPYPSKYAVSLTEHYSNIHFVKSLDKAYDCLVSLDVLEHVSDPLKLFSEMINSVKDGGYLVIANCFYPVIKCHLPCTFHLRYSFDKFAKLMGLQLIGPCEGSHATIYHKKESVPYDWKKIRVEEQNSRRLFPFSEFIRFIYRRLKKIV